MNRKHSEYCGWMSRVGRASARLTIFCLGAAMVVCGCLIALAGWRVTTELDEPYRRNIEALGATITELDMTVAQLQSDTIALDGYLTEFRNNSRTIADEVDGLRRQTCDLTNLAAGRVPSSMNSVAKSVKIAADVLHRLGNDTANYPLDSVQNARPEMYRIAREMRGLSTSIDEMAASIGSIAKETGDGAANLLDSSSKIIRATEAQIGVFQNGSISQVPNTLNVLSDQLKVHLGLLSSSVNLVRLVTWPVVMIGIGFLLAGLKAMFQVMVSGKQHGLAAE